MQFFYALLGKIPRGKIPKNWILLVSRDAPCDYRQDQPDTLFRVHLTMEPEIKWVKSQKGNLAPVVDGQTFGLKNKSTEKIYWRCSQPNCNSTIITTHHQEIITLNLRCEHPINGGQVLRRKFREKVKEFVSKDPTKSNREVRVSG